MVQAAGDAVLLIDLNRQSTVAVENSLRFLCTHNGLCYAPAVHSVGALYIDGHCLSVALSVTMTLIQDWKAVGS